MGILSLIKRVEVIEIIVRQLKEQLGEQDKVKQLKEQLGFRNCTCQASDGATGVTVLEDKIYRCEYGDEPCEASNHCGVLIAPDEEEVSKFVRFQDWEVGKGYNNDATYLVYSIDEYGAVFVSGEGIEARSIMSYKELASIDWEEVK